MNSVGSTDALTPEMWLEASRSRADRYELGQFFTPEPVARFMGQQLAAQKPSSVLDPAVGGGILLRAVGRSPRRFGIDIDPLAIRAASQRFGQRDRAELAVGDFLDSANWPFSVETFDAVIGNPPYIRHHKLAPHHKDLAKALSLWFNVKVSALSGSYVYFLLEGIRRLRVGGRLVFITPTEFLDARYGTALKQALLNTCEIDEILVLRQDDLAFDGVLTTSAITTVTRSDAPSGRITLTEGHLASKSVRRIASVQLDRADVVAGESWTRRLPSRAARILPLLDGRPRRLNQFASVRRGIATGDNAFFCLTDHEARAHRIESQFLVPVVVGSKDLPETGPLTPEHWAKGRDAGRKAWLLWCHLPIERLQGTNVLQYIELGERLGLPDRFNCRSRRPWYGVERVPPADFFVTYMSRQSARFVRNQAGARCMTSLLNLWAKPPYTADELERPLADGANAVLLREFGRTYGGGLGKIEPSDLLGLPFPDVPRPATVDVAAG